MIKTSCAYRFPMADISEGAGSAPLYAKQLFGEFFYDGGMAWDEKGEGDDRDWLDSMGLEVNFSLKLLRFIRIAPGLGFVYAPDRPKHSPGNEDEPDERYQIYITVKDG